MKSCIEEDFAKLKVLDGDENETNEEKMVLVLSIFFSIGFVSIMTNSYLKDDYTFVIKYQYCSKSLKLKASNQSERDLWVNGIHYYVELLNQNKEIFLNTCE